MDNDKLDIKRRIEKDIDLFYKNVGAARNASVNDKRLSTIIELSEMYAKDSKSFLDKGDFYTAFASINYAHGLLDAVSEMTK